MNEIAAIVLALAAASLCGCGQKGPLVRPDPHAPARPAAIAAPAAAAAAH